MEEIRKDLLTLTGSEIYEKYLLGNLVWYFKEHLQIANHYAHYDDLKKYIARKVGVHFNDVAIVGSAKTGFSFAPGKKLRPFTEQSDIDLVIVSQKYYKEIWNAYLDMFYKNNVPEKYQEINAAIFKGFISVTTSPRDHNDIVEWEKKAGEMMKDLQLVYGIKQDVNYRIYDSWDSVLAYHCHGLNNLINKHKKEAHDLYLEKKRKDKAITILLEILKNRKNGND
jgi:hypothetical protein